MTVQVNIDIISSMFFVQEREYIMKKLVAVLLSFVFALSLCTVALAEDFSTVNYYVEYGEDSATVIFQAPVLESFDFGIIYDPAKLTVSECDYSEDFYELALDDTYTTVYVKNPIAKDNVGENTYAVFTGIAVEAETAESVIYADKDIAKVTFTGIDEGDEIGVVMGTARVEDVRNAQKIGAVDLYKQMELSESDVFAGAKAEPNQPGQNNAGNNGWIYGVIIGVIVIVAVVAVIMSKKNSLDASSKDDDDEVVEDSEE